MKLIKADYIASLCFLIASFLMFWEGDAGVGTVFLVLGIVFASKKKSG